jgi:hypothetical protein
MAELKWSALIGVLLVTACSSNPVFVEFDTSQSTSSDWYPIPSDAPTRVEVTNAEVPRVEAPVIEAQRTEDSSVLRVTRLEDSFGNISLKLNRQPGTAWELIETALVAENIRITDKNRQEYVFELGRTEQVTGLASLFQRSENLKVVLIPQGAETLVAVEGSDDVVPDAKRVEDILTRLQDQLESVS